MPNTPAPQKENAFLAAAEKECAISMEQKEKSGHEQIEEYGRQHGVKEMEGNTMTNSFQNYAVVSLPDIELEGQISCARRRLVVVAPGLSESVAKAIVTKWFELGRDAVQVVLDHDPEICRLGFGDLAALKMLHEAAERMGARIHRQEGLRVGVIVTDETTTVYSPTARLIEAGGQPGDRLNALRFDTPILDPAATTADADLRSLDLHPIRNNHSTRQEGSEYTQCGTLPLRSCLGGGELCETQQGTPEESDFQSSLCRSLAYKNAFRDLGSFESAL